MSVAAPVLENTVPGEPGVVYLLHFHRPYRHAGHYIGWSRFLEKRLRHHERGTGARLMAAVSRAGITYTVARTWEGRDRNFERKLKNRKRAADLCPICRENRKKGRDACSRKS